MFCLSSICLEFVDGVWNCNDTNAVLRWNIKQFNRLGHVRSTTKCCHTLYVTHSLLSYIVL
jgi:hypothetical protein